MQEIEKGDGNIIEEGTDARVYELGYLLVPTISEENLGAAYGNLKEVIASFGGVFISDEMPKMLQLAYQMVKVVNNIRNKFNTAYFGWFKFSMDADKVLELKKKLDLEDNLVRFMLFKTVKENTVAAKRFVRGEMHRKPTYKKKDEETSVPMNKEEIDKEIDALVEA